MMDSPALIIIDLQKKFALSCPGMENSVKDHIGTVNKASAMFREAGRPVFVVKMDCKVEPYMYGGPDCEDFIEGFDVRQDDVVVHKLFSNSFVNTDLEYLLKKRGCKTILLAGLATQYCVLSTYYGGYDLGFEPYLLKDGTMTADESVNEAAEKICRVVAVGEVGKFLR